MKRISVSLLLALAACGAPQDATPAIAAPPPAAPVAPAEPKKDPVPPAPWKLPADANPALTDPSKATEKAPATYKVKFETGEGEYIVEVHRDWAPNGADRFYNLVKIGFFDDAAYFRVVDGFMVQFGINGYPQVNDQWREAKMPDDPVKQSNSRGKITFATSGKDSRTGQVFINFADNSNLDGMGFAPFGEVVSGMDVVDKLYKGYGEGAPRGRGPDQGRIQSEGNAYLLDRFPQLDYTKKATIVP